MTPREKAQAVVVAGMPAGAGFGGVLVRSWNTELPRPRGLVFADQEGGLVKTFASLPPSRAASSYRSAAEARAAGAATAAALRREGVHASFAPVLDLAGRAARLAPVRPAGVRRRVRARPRPRGVREALSRARFDAAFDRRGARLRRRPRSGPGAVPRRDPGGRAVRDGRVTRSTRGSARGAPRSSRRRTRCCGSSASAASRSPTRSACSAAPTRPSGRGWRFVRAPTSC